MNNPIQQYRLCSKDWETAFFGFPVTEARLGTNNPDAATLDDIIQEARSTDTVLLVLFSDLNPEVTLKDVLRAETPFYIEERIHLAKSLEAESVVSRQIDQVADTDTDTLFKLALLAGEHSRFHVDPHFPKHIFEDMYKTWVTETMAGRFDDLIICFREHQSPQGFVTARYREEEIDIGLIAVSPKNRGQGIAQQLLHEIEKKGLALAKKSLTLATQAINEPAINFYRHYGMRTEKTSFLTHVWLQTDTN